MIVEPRVRGFICTTAHPVGCAANVREQIDYVKGRGTIAQTPKRVLILGCSTGYGLASRIVGSFGGGARTIGVSMERSPSADKTASAGWYNNRAFEHFARENGRDAFTIEGDAFSDELKAEVIQLIKREFGAIDLLVYSLAAPVRTDPRTGVTYRSVIKPRGAEASLRTLNPQTGEVYEATFAPATEEETAATVEVMGGEDWERWIAALSEAGVLSDDFRTLNYTYIGSSFTWPIYGKGTLGLAKEDVDRAAEALRARLGDDAARVVALKAVVTQASSAIPVVPLYASILFSVMKEQGLHEGCIEQIDRLFRTRFAPGAATDERGRLRLDDWELQPSVQDEVLRRWPLVTTETLSEVGDLEEYRSEFLRMFGFGLDGVDYRAEVNPMSIDSFGAK